MLRAERVKHWRNGTWGRLARRDVEIWSGTLWKVVAWVGGGEGRETVRWFDDEQQAHTYAARCRDDGAGREWREVP